MKFKRYLAAQQEADWRGNYIRYAELKKLLHQILEAGAPVTVPTTLSLTVGKAPEGSLATPQEQFFYLLEADVKRISDFTTQAAAGLRSHLREVLVGLAGGGGVSGGSPGSESGALAARYSIGAGSGSGAAAAAVGSGPGGAGADLSDASTRDHWLAAARWLGEEYLRLEKYVNLNYTGLQKILKKHDKLIPTAPCWNFYKLHINRQPWVRGDHHDIQVTLSRIFSQLHSAAGWAAAGGGGSPSTSGNAASTAAAAAASLAGVSHHKDYQGSTYWVRMEDVALVKHVLMQHMAVQPPPTNAAAAAPSSAAGGAAALWAQCDSASSDCVNCMFLDNASLELYHNLLYGRPYATTLQLRWYGSRVPETVDIIRQAHREGWRPEDCTEDSFPIQETRVADFLNGRWTWADARKLMMPEEYDTRHKPHQPHQPHHHHHQGRYPTRHHLPHQGDAGPSNSGPATRGSPALPPSSSGAGGAGGGSSGGGGHSGSHQTHGSAPDDPARLAKEYQLFKTFTEVARLVESKGLQPMVQVRFRSTTYREPCDEMGLKVVLEEDVQMLLEYAYETVTRLSHGLWRQERPADAIEFPYAIFKVQRPHLAGEVPYWMQQLMRSGLLRPMHDFSKFIHACAGLLPDMVRAVPQWIDDEAVQKSLYANVMANEELQALLLAGHNVVAEMEEGVLEATAAAAAKPTRTSSMPAALSRKRTPAPTPPPLPHSSSSPSPASYSRNAHPPTQPRALRTQSLPLRENHPSSSHTPSNSNRNQTASAVEEQQQQPGDGGGGASAGGGGV